MRNLLIFMFLVGIFVLGSRSCDGFQFVFSGINGKGPVQTQTRANTGFHALDLNIPADVEVSVSDQFFVELSAQENLLSEIKTEVKDGVLRIYSDKNISSSEPIKITLSAPNFDRFSISGSGSIKALDSLHAATMDMEISGSGDISCKQGDFEEMSVKISGSGDIDLGGKAKEVTVNISGSGDVLARDLNVNNLTVRIAGAGSIRAHVESALKADIAGSGDVYYTGSPSVESKVSGSGTVKQVGRE